MITADTRAKDYPAPGYSADTRSRIVHPGDFLVPISLVLWAYGLSHPGAVVSAVRADHIVPLVFYSGIALLAVSAVLELRIAISATGGSRSMLWSSS